MFKNGEGLKKFLEESEGAFLELLKITDKIDKGENCCIWISNNTVEISSSVENGEGRQRTYRTNAGKVYKEEVISIRTEVNDGADMG